MDWGMILASVGISLILTVFGYLFVPTVLALSGKKYETKKLKRINIINCVIVWLMFRVLQIVSGNDPTSGAAVVLWGSVGYWILKKNCLKKSNLEQHTAKQTSFASVCLTDEGVPPSTNASNLTTGADVALKQDAIPQQVSVRHKVTPTVVRRPSSTNLAQQEACEITTNSKKLSDEAIKSHETGGQRAFMIILAIFFLMSFLINLYLLESHANMLEEISALKTEKTVLQDKNYELLKSLTATKAARNKYYGYYERNQNKVDVIDSWIVFIEDDGTRLYHKYECEKYTGAYGWAHNIEYAKYLGYQPCPLCSDE